MKPKAKKPLAKGEFHDPSGWMKGYFGEFGKMGRKARMAKISPERRSEIARNAVNARWKSARHDSNVCYKCNTVILGSLFGLGRDGVVRDKDGLLPGDKALCRKCAARWAKKREKDGKGS